MKKPKIYWYFNTLSYCKLIPQGWIKELIWKDKWATPRVECLPQIYISWLWFELTIIKGTDQYWEQFLWIHKYNGTKNTWPWRNGNTHNSSWIDY